MGDRRLDDRTAREQHHALAAPQAEEMRAGAELGGRGRERRRRTKEEGAPDGEPSSSGWAGHRGTPREAAISAAEAMRMPRSPAASTTIFAGSRAAASARCQNSVA
jgi:hypothetical protein